jgi:hypothetical protein
MTPNRGSHGKPHRTRKILGHARRAAAKHWAETRFYQYRRAKRSGADINEKAFPKRF